MTCQIGFAVWILLTISSCTVKVNSDGLSGAEPEAQNSVEQAVEPVPTIPTASPTPLPEELEDSEAHNSDYHLTPCSQVADGSRIPSGANFFLDEPDGILWFAPPDHIELLSYSIESGQLLNAFEINVPNSDYASKSTAWFTQDFRALSFNVYEPSSPPKLVIVPFVADQSFDGRQFSAVSAEFALSPDGTKLIVAGGAFTEQHVYQDGDHLLLYDFETASIVDLSANLSQRSPTYFDVAWSPTGKSIFYVASNETSYAQIMRYDLLSDTEQALTPEDMCAHEPTISPDGRLMAYKRYAPEPFASAKYIVVASLEDPDNEPPKTYLISHNRHQADLGDLRWSPDSRRIAFLGGSTYSAGVYVIDLESEETNQIHTDDLVGYSAKMSPVWINDGNGIGYVVDLATSFNDYDKHYAYRYTENIDSGEWRELIVVNPYSLD